LKITGLEISRGTALHMIRFLKKTVYVALGDSVTHGSVGLGGLSCQTYSAILAKKLDCRLYNLGVGGSKVSPPVGEMLKDWKKIDLITLLIGFNDMSWGGVLTDEYRASYLKLLRSIRKYHPNVPIFCITLTYIRLLKSKKTGVTPEQYRNVVREIVKKLQNEGDDNIHLLDGEKMTDDSFLHDNVHFNVKGNKMFAKKLYNAISKGGKLKLRRY
jgi:lysophospholipase L1-like esterase